MPKTDGVYADEARPETTSDFNTPVLFLVFNRPDTTRRVFEAIRRARPPRLYVASDGPREDRPGEDKVVAEVRAIATQVDWPCEVKTLFWEKNLGCGVAVSSAIDWFFSSESHGIILEDDCVPASGFFIFCQELLDRYRDDHRIGMISGLNPVYDKYNMPYDYGFSRYKKPWGWASWARAWAEMDMDMKWRETPQAEDIIENMGIGSDSKEFWKRALSLIDNKRVNAWDWPWFFCLAANSQLTIFPKVSLISNIGFGPDATHTNGRPKKSYISEGNISFPIDHPHYIAPDNEFDKQFERAEISIGLIGRLRRKIPNVIKDPIKRLVGRI